MHIQWPSHQEMPDAGQEYIGESFFVLVQVNPQLYLLHRRSGSDPWHGSVATET